jgi:hypothetical protein
MGLNNPEILHFFSKRADWLAHHQESGRLSNHQALIVLCLELLEKLLQSDRWNDSKQERLEQVLSWQNPEGWFQEYEGCDPGYQTLTIACLARVWELNPSNRLKDAIASAVILASQFIHPDGSYGGEYTSRNTYNFFPHGFELVGKWLPEALNINDRLLRRRSHYRSSYLELFIGLARFYSRSSVVKTKKIRSFLFTRSRNHYRSPRRYRIILGTQ